MIKINTQKRWIMIGLVFVGIGLTGGVFFFPVNINSQYTCLYHRMFSDENHAHMMGAEMGQHHQDSVTSSDESSPAMAQNNTSSNPNLEYPELLHRYVLPFGFIWWSSLSILFIGGYLVRRNFQNRKKLLLKKV